MCRDPDDNKFLECAVDAKAIYIVSGDKDLLTLEKYDNVEIITAREFCDRYIS
ncbi:MAG: putative toxin-antitoxin system toxin component, PIN family [Lachnospiraceae bacterium]|nr:putative toxin-antitoxin system toxin component, PIN family [Lachnospiraceae bacterium]